MIISCPECADPFDLPDDHIAELVQLACPHCAFRMILDFAAANDPGLIEQGMRIASGFRSAADYRAATTTPFIRSAEAASSDEALVPAASARLVADADPPAEDRIPAVARPGLAPVPREGIEPLPSAPPPWSITPPASPVELPIAAASLPLAAQPGATQIPVSAPSSPTAGQPSRTVPREQDFAFRDRREQTVVAPPGPSQRSTTLVPGAAQPQAPAGLMGSQERFESSPHRAERTPIHAPPLEPNLDLEYEEDVDEHPTVIRGSGGSPVEEYFRHGRLPEEPSVDLDMPRAGHTVPAPGRSGTPQRNVPSRTISAEPVRSFGADGLDTFPQADGDSEAIVDLPPSGRIERGPAHTPAGRAQPVQSRDQGLDSGSERDHRYPPQPAKPKGSPSPRAPRRSTTGAILVGVLVALVGGLVGSSLALHGTPDPRPLLEDLYRQVVKP